MRYVAAYLLVALAKDEVTVADVKNVLTSAAVEIDEERLNKLFEDVADKSITEIIAAGSSKLAKFGGGAAPAAAAAAPAAGAAKEEKKEEKKEEEDADLGGGMDMFGGGSDY
ncbi:Aste57867_20429 [Aphanomyces stellatus]|uniref:Aste57867_20429 protein n=1 Tax=Aphanomyces stellatus TaxID=120398 RepID=A0A485LG63_9STRA|nr:hypothetical protein As57867_020363 [Aphanomyces stellatus]VFT97115.1 Aste57867_20429 [Aphanomyces stellatus]